MDRPLARASGVRSAVLDSELGGFLYAIFAAHGNRAHFWTCSARRVGRRISLATAHFNSEIEMGIHSSRDLARALHDSECRTFSMELSVAAVFSSRSRDLRG